MNKLGLTKAIIIGVGAVVAYSYMGPLGLLVLAAILMFVN